MTKVTYYMYSCDKCYKIREMMEMDDLDCTKCQKSRRRDIMGIKGIVNGNKTKLVNRFLPQFEAQKRKCAGGEAVGWNLRFLKRERAPSLYDVGQSDRRFSTEQAAKLLYAVRATRGHLFGGAPTTPRGRNLFLLGLFFD